MTSEATFSRVFAQFAASRLPEHLHASLLGATQRERMVGYIACDSTAVPVRERLQARPLTAHHLNRANTCPALDQAATRLPLEEASAADKTFRAKEDDGIKVVLKP